MLLETGELPGQLDENLETPSPVDREGDGYRGSALGCLDISVFHR